MKEAKHDGTTFTLDCDGCGPDHSVGDGALQDLQRPDGSGRNCDRDCSRQESLQYRIAKRDTEHDVDDGGHYADVPLGDGNQL